MSSGNENRSEAAPVDVQPVELRYASRQGGRAPFPKFLIITLAIYSVVITVPATIWVYDYFDYAHGVGSPAAVLSGLAWHRAIAVWVMDSGQYLMLGVIPAYYVGAVAAALGRRRLLTACAVVGSIAMAVHVFALVVISTGPPIVVPHGAGVIVYAGIDTGDIVPVLILYSPFVLIWIVLLRRFRVRPHVSEFQRDIDTGHLNQLPDALDAAEFASRQKGQN